MKKILIIIISVFLVSVSVNFNVNAETAETRISLEGRTLIIEEIEVKGRKEIPNVPSGINIETAHQLVMGEPDEKVIEEKKEVNFLFGFPVIKQVTRENKVVTYDENENGWKERKEVFSKKTEDYPISSIIGLLVICILTTSFLCQFFVAGYKRLIIFYIAILLSAVVGVPAGVLVGKFGVLVVAIFVGAMSVGIPTALIVEKSFKKGELTGALMGAFTGMYLVILAGEFTKVGVKNFLYYLLFIVVVEIISFAIVFITQKIKMRLTTPVPSA